MTLAVRAESQGLLRQHRLILLVACTVAVVAAAYWQSFSRMLEMWSLSNYQYCWLVYPMSLYLLWRKRKVLSAAGVQWSGAGLALTVLFVIVWIVARSSGVQAIEFGAATVLVFSAFWAIAGVQAMKEAAFPLLLLLAAVPVGDVLVGPLVDTTATIATALLQMVGVPVFRDGNFLTLPGGVFEVANVCSGLRFLLAGSMASLAFAYLTYRSVVKRVSFVCVAAIALVLANGVRAFVIMLVASGTEMRLMTGEGHVVFGMVLFVLVFMLLVAFGQRYADRDSNRPSFSDYTRGGEHGRLSIAPAAIVLAVVVTGPLFQYAKAEQVPAAINAASLPSLPGCTGPEGWDRNWTPRFAGADNVYRGSYACGDLRSNVYVASYVHQKQGKELINSVNRVWPDEWRRYADEVSVRFQWDAGAAEVRQVLVSSPEKRMLIWYWYQTGDVVTESELEMQLRAALRALSLQPKEASVVAIGLPIEEGADLSGLRERMAPLVRAVMSWNRDKADHGSGLGK